MPKPLLNVVNVHMGYGEWDRTLPMHKLADEQATLHPRPLMVEVHEHGGWWLQFLYDDAAEGLIIGSANGCAVRSAEALAAIRRYQSHDWNYLADVRRPTAPLLRPEFTNAPL